MASIQQDPKSKTFRIRFRFGGRRYFRSLKTTELKVAQSILGRVEETLRLLDQGRLEIPAKADPGKFILSDGKITSDRPRNPFGSVVIVDLRECTIDIKKRRDTADRHCDAIFEFTHIGPGSMPESLFTLGEQIARAEKQGKQPRTARFDLLSRQPPRFRSLTLPRNGDFKDVAIELARDLDNSCLAIQGPPGSGKTFVGSHMIYELAKSGKRVGVSAVGHQVIINLLSETHQRAVEAGAGILLAHQNSDDDLPGFIKRVTRKDKSLKALGEGYAVGGTAWLWSDQLMEQELDYLFIDEAGQMSLAMAGECTARGFTRQRKDRHGRQIPGPGGAHGHLLDDELFGG